MMLISPTLAQEVRRLANGDRLFRQGDAASAIYGVERGGLRLERRTYDGRLVTLHTARAGEFFAEAALFASHYHCDAVAIEPDTEVRVYAKRRVLDAIATDPAAAASLLAGMARQIHTLRQRLELRNVRSARERVLLALDLQAQVPSRVVRIEGELQDFAADLGLTREAFYRTLSALEAEGLIERDGLNIRLTKAMGV